MSIGDRCALAEMLFDAWWDSIHPMESTSQKLKNFIYGRMRNESDEDIEYVQQAAEELRLMAEPQEVEPCEY